MMINKINGVNRKPLKKERSKSNLYWQKENLNKQKLLVLQVKLLRYLLSSGYLTPMHLTFHPYDLLSFTTLWKNLPVCLLSVNLITLNILTLGILNFFFDYITNACNGIRLKHIEINVSCKQSMFDLLNF